MRLASRYGLGLTGVICYFFPQSSVVKGACEPPGGTTETALRVGLPYPFLVTHLFPGRL